MISNQKTRVIIYVHLVSRSTFSDDDFSDRSEFALCRSKFPYTNSIRKIWENMIKEREYDALLILFKYEKSVTMRII